MPAETQSLARARLLARAPRIALIVATGVLTLAGLRAAIAPGHAAPATVAATSRPPQAVAAFAEAFVRDYLTWTAADDGQREQRLSGYLADDLDDDGGMAPRPGSTRTPRWTVAGEPRAAGHERWEVPVMAALSGGSRLTVTVPVTTGRDGRQMTVSDYPAITALAARGNAPADRYPHAIEDPELERVITRATRNYLAGNTTDLQADLAPGTRLTTPDQTSRLLSIDDIAWQTEGRTLAVLATTQTPDGTQIRTRLHITCVRQTRWFLAHIN